MALRAKKAAASDQVAHKPHTAKETFMPSKKKAVLAKVSNNTTTISPTTISPLDPTKNIAKRRTAIVRVNAAATISVKDSDTKARKILTSNVKKSSAVNAKATVSSKVADKNNAIGAPVTHKKTSTATTKPNKLVPRDSNTTAIVDLEDDYTLDSSATPTPTPVPTTTKSTAFDNLSHFPGLPFDWTSNPTLSGPLLRFLNLASTHGVEDITTYNKFTDLIHEEGSLALGAFLRSLRLASVRGGEDLTGVKRGTVDDSAVRRTIISAIVAARRRKT